MILDNATYPPKHPPISTKTSFNCSVSWVAARNTANEKIGWGAARERPLVKFTHKSSLAFSRHAPQYFVFRSLFLHCALNALKRLPLALSHSILFKLKDSTVKGQFPLPFVVICFVDCKYFCFLSHFIHRKTLCLAIWGRSAHSKVTQHRHSTEVTTGNSKMETAHLTQAQAEVTERVSRVLMASDASGGRPIKSEFLVKESITHTWKAR